MVNVFLICLLVLVNSLFAQVDSLDQMLPSPEEQDLVDQLNELSFTIAQSDPNLAKEMANEAAEKALNMGYD